MSAKRVKITINAFHGDDEIELSFPDNWEVQECRMLGHGRPTMKDDEIRAALRSPFGTPRLSELANGKKEVCILFDDLPKPTQISRIVPFVIEELHAGGITDEHIRFICAPGTHRPLLYQEFEAKLGREIVEKYLVFNHSVWENLVFKGNTASGTPVWVNREFDACDLRVAIGSIFPHPSAGFGGGAKIIMPGICGMETIAHHHRNLDGTGALMKVEGNPFRDEIEAVGRIAMLHFKVDVVMNDKRQAIGVFCGDFVQEHRAGAKMAREMYATPMAKNADVVVANAYPDEPQMGRAHWVFPQSLKDGGDGVVIAHSLEGQNLHQLRGRFGSAFGGRLYVPGGRYPNLAKVARVILMTPNLSKYDRDEAGPPEKVVWCQNWSEVLAELTSKNGPGTRVAVYPYSPLQIPAA